jgi:shikimate dehydrogenase
MRKAPERFAGLIGSHIQHSLSPEMHTAWFEETGFSCCYLKWESPEDSHALRLLQDLMQLPAFLGANITAPYKTLLTTHTTLARSDLVKSTGATNTLYRNSQGEWALENTDVTGIERTLHKLGYAQRPGPVLCLGAGGAARAVAPALARFGQNSKFYIACRDSQQKAKQLKDDFPAATLFVSFEEACALAQEPLFQHGLVINALPAGVSFPGSEADSCALKVLETFTKKHSSVRYFDMLYLDTSALAFAKSQKIEACDGKLMLQEQARVSFQLWTGCTPKLCPLIK